jgi:hypothetical protein
LPAVKERLAIPVYISGILGFEDGALAIWTIKEDFDQDILVNLKHAIEISVFFEQLKQGTWKLMLQTLKITYDREF